MLEKYCKGYWLSQKNLTLPPKDVRTMLEYVRKIQPVYGRLDMVGEKVGLLLCQPVGLRGKIQPSNQSNRF